MRPERDTEPNPNGSDPSGWGRDRRGQQRARAARPGRPSSARRSVRWNASHRLAPANLPPTSSARGLVGREAARNAPTRRPRIAGSLPRLQR